MADSSFNLTSLITSPISGAFQYAGAKKQAQAAEDALSFAKQKQAEQQAAFAPYQALGQQAVGMLPSAVRPIPTTGPPAPYSTMPGSVPQAAGGVPTVGTPLSQMGGVSPQAQQMSAQGPMVTLQAPDGSTKAVPQSQAQYYISKGAKQVQ